MSAGLIFGLCYYALMKKQVLHIHGGDSFSQREDFLQYLKVKTIRDLPGVEKVNFWTKTLLEDLGDEYEVFMPAMPNSTNAHYEEWKIWFERYFTYLREEVILVGWSLGGMFLAKYLSENKPPFSIKSLYLLAAPSGEWPEQADGNDCASFRFTTQSAGNIAKTADKIEIWHSHDDFVVPVTEADWYQKHLPGSKLRLFGDKSHFLVPELPELVSAIKNS